MLLLGEKHDPRYPRAVDRLVAMLREHGASSADQRAAGELLQLALVDPDEARPALMALCRT